MAQKTHVGEGGRHRSPRALPQRMHNGAAVAESGVAVPPRVKCRTNICSSNSVGRYTPRRLESGDSNKCLHIQVHNGAIYDSQKVERVQASTGR